EEVVRSEVTYSAVARGALKREALADAERCFSLLNLGGASLLERRVWELSGGVRRLVEVVGGLIAPASLLALDEPTAGLDRPRREALVGLVTQRAESSAVLIASQDEEWLRRLGARVQCLRWGGLDATPSLSKK